ncbi:hypothetical protein Lmac_0340 [Legionella maceachernii]|uniref:Uncharacterized protein n=1 Tax=Legionella maceachernii TaxID=466 RepID=A0A0W0WGW2_9GAMM|nr:hypothetical protein Lmac_0340 [Legionella maceachernii]SKA00526.1 hypothetical protein SAMN02745128_01748 [Legionella maceachernii]SUP01342.1 Uncharacterised protein [Legionella maceachernii]
MPSETPITQAFLTETRNELRDTLISFLTIFSMVHFENADDQFNALLINKLKEFLEEIVKDLRTLNPLAHMKILEFQGKLLRHLDLIAPLFSAGTRNELDPNQIDAFVKTVLSTTTKPVTRDSRPKIINGLLNIASTNLNRFAGSSFRGTS